MTALQSPGSFDLTIPDEGRIVLWVKENDGTDGEVALTDLAPALLQMGDALGPITNTERDRTDDDVRTDFGYFEIPDGTVFVRDGEEIPVEDAAIYLERGIVESLKSALERHEPKRSETEQIVQDLAGLNPIVGRGYWGFYCPLCGADVDELDADESYEAKEAHRRSHEWHHDGCVWVRAKRHTAP